MKSDDPITSNNVSPFASLDILRDAHKDLLKHYRDQEITSAIADVIKEFIRRGQATGALLEDEEERWDAQSRLDYWAAKLQQAGHELPSAILSEFNPTVELDNVIQRIAAEETTEEDLQLLRNVMAQNAEQGLVQLGKYNVNIAQGQDIQIGDRIYQGVEAETIRQLLSELLEARKLRALLTHAEFSDRVEQSALTSYQVPLVGRDELLQQIQQALSGDNQVIVLHGLAGLGKTRLLLALIDVIDVQKRLWYVRNEAESIEPELASLDSRKQYIIVVDDAHRFKLLYELREVLINPKFAGKITLILATRSNFKESVLYQLDVRTSPVSTIEIEPLQNADIDQILEGPPYQLSNRELRYTIVKIAEGNPLIAGIAARLSKQGVALSELTRDQLLTRYLDDIIRDLSGGNTESDFYLCCIRYLQVLAALGTISLKDEELQSKIYQVMPPSGRGSTFTSLDEARLVSRLVEAGIVEQYGQTLKISSEVLADYILIQHFFNLKTKQADYQKLIIEPFFQLKPREVLTSLAEAEFKGESSEAGSLLAHNLNELRRAISREGNVFRLNLLRSLREVAYLRPDDILAIVATIVDAPELPPETVQVELFGPYPIGQDWVLSEAVEVLERTIYRGDIRNTIDYLYKLACYKHGAADYEKVRAKAKKALTEIAEFKLRKPYAVQQTLLDKISDWLEKDFERNLALSLVLIQPMLKVDFHDSKTDPTKPFTINIHQGSLEIASDLRRIRDRALEILCNAYRQVQDLPTRMQIVQILCGATYTSNPKDRTSSQTQQQLQADCAQIAHFFSETVLPSVELPIFDRIAEWLRQAQHFNKYQAVELDHLKQQLKEHRGYQLYRLLVGGYRWDEEGNRLDWQTIEQQKRQKIQEYVAEISPSTLDQAIQELEVIAKQARDAGKNDTFGLNDLLVILGQTQSALAQQFIERVLVHDLTLKQHLGFVLAGLRLADQKAARAYVQSWLEQEESILWAAIALSYRFIDWSQPQLEEEWDTLRQLVAKQSLAVDWALFWSIRQLAPYNPDLAVELLKILATREDEAILRQVAELIAWPAADSEDRWAITFKHPQGLQEIVQNFERLSYLDYEAEQCLKRLSEISPMWVIDLIERRIAVKREGSRETSYEAFPQPFTRAFDNIRSHPEYSNILRRIRDWMLSDDFWLRFQAPNLIEGIALNLDDELCDVLMEWILTGDEERLKGVSRILGEFNSGQRFYDLSREIILRTTSEDVLSPIYGAICTTRGVVSGPMSIFYKQRLEEINPWLQDPELKVRTFAQDVAQSLHKIIEQEEAEEKFRERNW